LLNRERIKLIKSLSRKSERQSTGLFVVEGRKNVQELLESIFEVETVYTTDSSFGQNSELIGEKEMERISHLKNASSYLALGRIPQDVSFDYSKKAIFLDRINDPGNLGAVIRIADWFGFDQVVCSPNSVDCYNSKVIMASMGSAFRVPVIYDVLENVIGKSDFETAAAVFDGTSLYEFKNDNPVNVLMGSEAHGIEETLVSKCTHKLTIPKVGKAESLNLSVSCGIICSHLST